MPVLEASLREVAWPMQAMLVVMSLLGKKQGGTRTVALAASFYRLVMALLKPPMRAWDMAVKSERDSAAPGQAPMRVLAGRHLDLELVAAAGNQAVGVFWDARRFLDSLDVPGTIAAAKR